MSTRILSALSSLQDLDIATDAASILDRLKPCLARYAELEMRPDGSRLDLITLSDQIAEIDGFLGILKERIPSAEGMANINALVNFGAGHTMGMKLPLAGDLTQGELYIRGALPFQEVRFFLANHEVSADLLDCIAEIGKCFDKDYCHMLSADAGTTEFSVFFTTYLRNGEEKGDAGRLRKAMDHLNISEAGQQSMIQFHDMLGAARPCTLYFSLKINKDSILGAKADYPDIRVGSISALMQAVLPESKGRLPIDWGQSLNCFRSNFTGVLLGKQGPRDIRAYFPLPG